MNGVFTGISRMLWFFYRVIYTLLPATMFVIALYTFVHFNFIYGNVQEKVVASYTCYNMSVIDDEIGDFAYHTPVRIIKVDDNKKCINENCHREKRHYAVYNRTKTTTLPVAKKGDGPIVKFIFYLYSSFYRLSTTWKVLFTVLLIIFVDVVVEAMVLRVTYRALNFQKVCDDMYRSLRKELIPYRTRFKKSFTVFNLMEVRSLVTDGKVADRVEYLLAREFLFNNTWMLLLISNAIFVPYTLYNIYGLKGKYGTSLPIFFMLLSFVLAVLITSRSWCFIKRTKRGEVYDHFSGDVKVPVGSYPTQFLESDEYAEAYILWVNQSKGRMRQQLDQLWQKKFRSKLIDKYKPIIEKAPLYVVSDDYIDPLYQIEREFLTSSACIYAYNKWVRVESLVQKQKNIIKEEIRGVENKHKSSSIYSFAANVVTYFFKGRTSELGELINTLSKYVNISNQQSINKSHTTRIHKKTYEWVQDKKEGYTIERERGKIMRRLFWSLLLALLFIVSSAYLGTLDNKPSWAVLSFLIDGIGSIEGARFFFEYIGIQLIVFVMTYFILASAFGEYLDVEKTIYAYFVHELNRSDDKFVLKPPRNTIGYNNSNVMEPPDGEGDDVD